jgi:hypothetical protein
MTSGGRVGKIPAGVKPIEPTSTEPPASSGPHRVDARVSEMKMVDVDLRQELARELAAESDQWAGMDLQLSVGLLFGRRASYGGREFFKAKSFEDRTGRQALARLPRGPQPLSRLVRSLLANLIDVESPDFRQIHFKRRGKKRLPASIRDYDIAYFVAWRVETGKLMKNVKEDARYHFKRGNAKISKSTVDRAWGKHGAAMTDHVRGILSDLKKPYVPKKAPSS